MADSRLLAEHGVGGPPHLLTHLAELIARTLVTREGQPWIMRLRSIETLTGWAREAGFTDFSSRTDPWGIFHVIIAR